MMNSSDRGLITDKEMRYSVSRKPTEINNYLQYTPQKNSVNLVNTINQHGSGRHRPSLTTFI